MSSLLSNMALASTTLMFSAGMYKFITSWSHLLTTLITLEFIALSLFLNLTIFPVLEVKSSIGSIFFLALAVCEGALGLSILILYARYKGHDMLSSKSFLQW